MKRKEIFAIILIYFICLTGCNLKKEKTLKEKIDEKHTFVNQIKCEFDGNIIGLDATHLVTNKKMYDFNVKKIFSNEQNCKLVSEEKIFNNLLNEYRGYSLHEFDASLIKTYDDFGNIITIYNLCSSDYCIGDSLTSNTIYNNHFANLISGLGSNIVYCYNCNYNDFYHYSFVSVDNKIKKIKIKESFNPADDKKTYSIDSIKEIKTPFSDDEYVVNLNKYYVKTNKAYYQIKKYTSNKEECEKYADIKCKKDYKIVKDDVLSKNYDDIIIADFFILDKDYNVYFYRHEKYIW